MALEINECARKEKILGKNMVLDTTMLDMFAKSGSLDKAREIFEVIPTRVVVCWSAMIGGYVQHGFGEEALNCFNRMRYECVSPDSVTFIWVVKACRNTGLLDIAEEIHSKVQKEGLLAKDVVLGTTLVDLYAKCGDIKKAQKCSMSSLFGMQYHGPHLFQGMLSTDLVTNP